MKRTRPPMESLSIKVDKSMKLALEKAAKEEFTSVSSIIKKSVAKYLEEVGIDWREGYEED